MNDHRHRVRLARLARLGDEAAARELSRDAERRTTVYDDVLARLLAYEYLSRRTSEIRDRFAGLLDTDAELRALAVIDLCELYNTPLTARLGAIAIALHDPVVGVRRAAMLALWGRRLELSRLLDRHRLGDPCPETLTALLADVLCDDDAEVRDAAARMLVWLERELPHAGRRALAGARHALELTGVEPPDWTRAPSTRQYRRHLRAVHTRGGSASGGTQVECTVLALELLLWCLADERPSASRLRPALEALRQLVPDTHRELDRQRTPWTATWCRERTHRAHA